MKENEKTGKLLIIISIALIPISLLLSSGYYPQAGFLYGIQNSIYLIDLSIMNGAISEYECMPNHDDCIRITILTKYIITILLALITYGVLVFKGLLKSPTSYFSNTQNSSE